MSERLVVNIDADLAELIPLFLQSRQQDLVGLANGLAVGDFDSLHLIGHSMKGAGSSYGFEPVSNMGDRIENAALASDATTIHEQTAALQDYLARIDINLV